MSDGIFVAAKIAPESQKILADYGKILNLPGCKLHPADKFHVSIMYCKSPIAIDSYPIDTTPHVAVAYDIRYIGNALAIILESHWLRQRFKFAKLCGLYSQYAGFIPHLSLCYDPPGNLPVSWLPKPARLPIQMLGEYTEPLK